MRDLWGKYLVVLAILFVAGALELMSVAYLLTNMAAESSVTGIADRSEFLVLDTGNVARELGAALTLADEQYFRDRLRANASELGSNVRCLLGEVCSFGKPRNWPTPEARDLLIGGPVPGAARLETFRSETLALAAAPHPGLGDPHFQAVVNHQDELVAVLGAVMQTDRSAARKSRQTIPLIIGAATLILVGLLSGYFLVAVAPLVRRVQRRTAQLERAKTALLRAQEIANVATWEYDIGQGQFQWSDELYTICGQDREEPIPAAGLLAYCHPEEYEATQRAIDEALRERSQYAIEHRVVRPDGSVRWVYESGEFVYEGDEASRAIGTVLDVTERKLAENRATYLAHHDTLTGLPNRRLLIERLELALTEAVTGDRSIAVLFIDFDRFKRVNDTLGHHVGDEVLVAATRRLLRQVRETDTLARVGGDEFVVVLESIEGKETAARVAQALVEAFSRPLSCSGRQFAMTVSVGVSVSGVDGMDSGELLRAADAAMYAAKRQGRNVFVFHTGEMDDESRQRLATENELREGIERGELLLFYQPIVEASGRIKTLEALVRWEHPQRGLLSPDAFIAIAEESGLIVPLGEQVLRIAAMHAAQWAGQGILQGRIGINVSGVQFGHEGFMRMVDEVLEQTRCDGRFLDIEITESVIMQDPGAVALRCEKLHERGIRLSIDDFGTGYSSLASLKRFPFDTLKIDRSFISDMGESDASVVIPRSIIALAHSLGLSVVAEGVETPLQAAILRELACDAMQGFLFSRPLPPHEVQTLLESATSLHEAGNTVSSILAAV